MTAAVLSPLSGFIVARIRAPLWPDTTISLYMVTMLLELLMIGLPALLLMLRKKEEYRSLLLSPSLNVTGLVSLSSVSYVLTAVLITTFWVALLQWSGFQFPLEGGMPSVSGANELMIALFSAAVVPAISEELMFRGVLLRFLLKKFSEKWAVLICGISFSLLHFSFQGIASLAVFGIFLSVLTIRYHNLWLAIIFHFLYNSLVIIMQSFVRMPSAQTVFLCSGIFIATIYLLFYKREVMTWN